jgi:anti-sigma regulatory factor (Ser/Thr protein kinase)
MPEEHGQRGGHDARHSRKRPSRSRVSVVPVGASNGSDDAWALPAVPTTVGQLRRRAAAFAAVAGASEEMTHAVALAVSETVTNAVMHAYVGTEPGLVSVRCRAEGDRVIIEVKDSGKGIGARNDSPGVGHGLATVGALAQTLAIATRPDIPGTIVTMSFGPTGHRRGVPGLEPLCTLALELVADVSCVDVVHGGVLRRAAAEVAGDSALTAWLREAIPPARPGTATWAALREGGAHLVVHDPSVPRSPGGTGERLGLTWWVAVPLGGADATPASLWGLGGRDGGRPVPSRAVLDALAEAARSDLTQETQRAVLRGRLALT